MALGLAAGLAVAKGSIAAIAGMAARQVTKEILINLLEDDADNIVNKYGVHVLAGVAGIGAGVFVNKKFDAAISDIDKAIKFYDLMQKENLTPEEQGEELIKILFGVKKQKETEIIDVEVKEAES